jgi:hypothetical protein
MRLSPQTLLHLKPGRKRFAARRPGADRDHRQVEPEHVVKAVAVAQRVRRGVSADDASNYLHESAIGTLYRRWQLAPEDPASISRDQFHAAEAYRACVIRHCRLVGIPSPYPRAHDPLILGAGRSCEAEPDHEVVATIRARFRDARRALLDCGAALGVGSRINAIVYAVVIEEIPAGQLSRHDIQNLRCGLNALRKIFR